MKYCVMVGSTTAVAGEIVLKAAVGFQIIMAPSRIKLYKANTLGLGFLRDEGCGTMSMVYELKAPGD